MTLFRSPLAVAAGVRAAWSAPATISRGLSSLVDAPATPAAHSPSHPLGDAPLASRVSHAGIRWLTRLAPTRWRNTCLYRSVAECAALRTLGLPARLVIGVGASGPKADVVAHAWVECEGVSCLSTRGEAELETMSATGRHARAGAS